MINTHILTCIGPIGPKGNWLVGNLINILGNSNRAVVIENLYTKFNTDVMSIRMQLGGMYTIIYINSCSY